MELTCEVQAFPSNVALAEAALATLSACSSLDSWKALGSIAHYASRALSSTGLPRSLSGDNQGLDGWEGEAEENGHSSKTEHLLLQLKQVCRCQAGG